MSQDSSQERTEAPTQRRRDDARRKGQVPRSTEMSNAVAMFGTAMALWLSVPVVGRYLLQIIHSELSTFHQVELTVLSATGYFARMIHGALWAIIPTIGIATMVALIGAIAQSGLSISFEPMALDWSRISIVKGWQRLFSLTAGVRGITFFVKLSLLVVIVAGLTLSSIDDWVTISRSALSTSIEETWQVAVFATFIFAAMLVAIGAADYAYQWIRNEQELMMTVQQLRDESKDQEGDPKLKQRIRSLQREAVKLQMLRDVPAATVVLTNPTHIAVAIRYERAEMSTPIVVAKGTGAFAKRIAAIARENGIPVMERKPLARALYASAEVNQEIPVALYKAIAEILAYVYGLKRSA